MFNKIFSSIISNGAFTGSEFAISTIVAIICGVFLAGFLMTFGVAAVTYLIGLAS